MPDTHSHSGDNAKLILAVIGFMALIATIIGIIPVAVLLVGLAISIKGGDAANIEVTTKLVQFMLAGVACWLLYQSWSSYQTWGWLNDGAVTFLQEATLLGVGVFAVSFLWAGPLVRKVEGRAAVADEKAAPKSPSIIRRESFGTYSTADELRKWRDLRDEGTITEQEFQEARTKILAR